MVGARTQEPSEAVLVLCRANVARSPLAGAMLRAALDRAGRRDVAVDTAGLDAEPGVPASDLACEVARARGLDLVQHSSGAVSHAALANASLVLTMSEAQRATVARLVPGLISRTFTLPELGRLLSSEPYQGSTITELAVRAHRARPRTAPADGPEDISDPIGLPLRQYQRTADRIAQLVDEIAAHVRPALSATEA